jgi:transposase
MAGTIFEKSTTSLKLWFTAIYMFSISRNGVAALELERQLGVSRKCAWRMGMKIRSAMKQDTKLLSGVVEADEAYYGGRRRSSNRYSNKVPLLGVVERGGNVRIAVSDVASSQRVTDFLGVTVRTGSILNTDESHLYKRVEKLYRRKVVTHGRYQFVDGGKYTNTIEHIWGMLKPSLLGTHRSVSKQHLQLYVNEAVWKYNYRGEQLFPLLLDAVAQPV